MNIKNLALITSCCFSIGLGQTFAAEQIWLDGGADNLWSATAPTGMTKRFGSMATARALLVIVRRN